ncbi:MAG TPA: hypothetical protein VLF41_03300 [Candidatus Nanoarchaeia archaeon]|nr:hypothetical protein [Candidatus Nanoarchaeia archaeon]
MIIRALLIAPLLAISTWFVGFNQANPITPVAQPAAVISVTNIEAPAPIQATSTKPQPVTRVELKTAPAPACTDTVGHDCPAPPQKPTGFYPPAPVCTDTIGNDCPTSTPPPNRCAYPMTCPEQADNDGIVPTRCAIDLPCGDTPGPTQDYHPPVCTKYDVCGAQPANDSL